MSDFPVYVNVRRPDGSTEAVRVGTATRSGDGFLLQLGELTIGGAPAAAPAPGRSAPPARAPSGGGGMNFPNYGRSKGAPIAGASPDDLQYYANGCRRTLADPGKQRWHDKERELLAAIEAEMRRQGIDPGDAKARRPRPSFMDAPPPTPEPPPSDEPPPPGDDDVPF